MLQLRIKQTLALFLCAALIRPTPMMSEPAPGAVLGSVTPRGEVNVGDVRLPGMSALFVGDSVRTSTGSAMIQYQNGPRVVLGLQSQASFTPSKVELQKGQMSFRTEAGGPQFAASTLRIEPIEAKSAADVTYLDHKATVSVTEGSFRVVDPSGVQLASLRTGEARLFEEAAASVPGPPAAAAPPAVPAAPQLGSGGSNRAWLLALGVGVVGTSLGIAALVRASDADDRADVANQSANQARSDAAAAAAAAAAAQAAAAQAQSQAASALAQAAALQAQLATLQAQLAASSEATAAAAAGLQQLASVQNRLNRAQTELSELISAIAAQGGTATPAQLSQLQSLTGQLRSLFQAAQQVIRDLVEGLSEFIP
jgi:chemotaxis protein histidine kinase CheA